MFRKPTPVDRRPEGLEKFRRDLDVAIASAQHSGIGIRALADILSSEAEKLQVNAVVSGRWRP